MHRFLTRVTAAAAVAAFAAFAQAQTAPAPATETPALLSAADHLAVRMGSRPAGGAKRVAISTFFVQFVRDLGIERDAGTFGMFQGQSRTFFTSVRGVEPAVLQQVADGLYDSFVKDLEAGGVQVLPQATLDANPDYQALRQAGKASPVTSSLETGTGRNQHMAVNVFVSAKGLPFIARNVLDKKWLTGEAFPGEGYAGMVMVLGPSKIAQALQSGLLNVRLTVALVEQKGKGWGGTSVRPDFVLNRWVKTAEASWQFETDPYARWVEEGTQLMLSNPNGEFNPNPFVLALKQPVPIAGLEMSGAKGAGGNARGSGLLGALGRAVSSADAAPADLYIDVNAANFAERLLAEGRPLMKLFAEALAAPR